MIACIAERSRVCSAAGAKLIQSLFTQNTEILDKLSVLKRIQRRINFISSLDFLSTDCCPSHGVFVSPLCEYFLSSLQRNVWVTDAAYRTPTDYTFTYHNHRSLVQTRDFLFSNHPD
jgi:hypothetical protein